MTRSERTVDGELLAAGRLGSFFPIWFVFPDKYFLSIIYIKHIPTEAEAHGPLFACLYDWKKEFSHNKVGWEVLGVLLNH